MIGIDLEIYSNSSNKNQIFAGYNTSNDDLYLQVLFNGLAGNTVVRADTYAMYDAVMICENGVCSIRF